MAGMNTGPSAGFMARFKQNLPQAINMAGQQFGGSVFGPAARITGTLMKPTSKVATAAKGMANQPTSGKLPTLGSAEVPVNGPSNTGISSNQPGTAINNHDTGIVRGPSVMPPMFGPGMNTGITGGYMPGQLGTMAQNAGSVGATPMGGGMGMFDAYNRLRRPMFA